MDFFVERATGRLLVSPDYPRPITDTPSAKLQSVEPIRIQYLTPGATGTAYVPCAAPSSTIKFGLKPDGHYSDLAFDVFTDGFTTPTDPTLADAFYTATLTIDSVALRALFPVGSDGKSADFIPLIGEILSGTSPSVTFDFNAQNNVIKGDEQPAQAVPGPSGYPTAAKVSALVTPYQITYTSGQFQLPDGTVRAFALDSLTNDVTVVLPPYENYDAGQVIELYFQDPNGHFVNLLPSDGDAIDGFTFDDGGQPVIYPNSTKPNTVRVLRQEDGQTWNVLTEILTAAHIGTTAGKIVVVGQDGKLPAQLVSAPAPTAGLFVNMDFSGVSTTVERNLATPGFASVNLFVAPEGLFASTAFWSAYNADAVTDNYGVDPSGTNRASRWQATAAGANLGAIFTYKAPLTVGKSYTISIYVSSRTGAAQKIRHYYNSAWGPDLVVPATGWVRLTSTFTFAGGDNTIYPLAIDAAADAQDLLFWGAQLELGSVATAYKPAAADMTLLGAPARTNPGIDLSGGIKSGIVPVPGIALPGTTVYMNVNWPLANAAASPNAVGLLRDPNGVFLAASNNNIHPAWSFGPSANLSLPYANFHTGQDALIVAVASSAGLRLLYNGTELGTLATVIDPIVSSYLIVGKIFAGTANPDSFPGTIKTLRVYNEAHNPAQIAAVSAVLGYAPLPKFVAFEGDSIVSGQSPTQTDPIVYPRTAIEAITPVVQARNLAVPGSSIPGTAQSTLMGRAAALDALLVPGGKNVLFVGIGTNDIDTYTPAQFLANLTTYNAARHSAGWNKILWPAILPNTNAGANAKRNVINAAVAANPALYGVDIFVRFDLDPTMGLDSAAFNHDLYPDERHPSTLGYSYLWPLTRDAINAAFAP